MHIQVDANTTGAELFHLSILFRSLAGARGFAVPKASTKLEDFTVSLNIDTHHAAAALDKLASHPHFGGEPGDPIKGSNAVVEPVRAPADMTAAEHFQTCVEAGTVTFVEPSITNDNLDSAGLPWDARIHAGSRERNTDGSWRVRRRPKGVEEAEWEATLARVTSELRDLMEIPVTPGAVADAAAEEALTDDEILPVVIGGTGHVIEGAFVAETGTVTLTDAEVDEFVDIGHALDDATIVPPPVAVAPPVVVAPPAIEPPVTAVAPPIATASPTIETFAQVMTFLTARTPKDEAAKPAMVAKVNEILAANGLTVLTQLGQRPDLIPQVVEQFKAAFGE